jgi:hypothetical protein
VVGDKGLDRGVIEYKSRADGTGADVPLEAAVRFIQERRGTRR